MSLSLRESCQHYERHCRRQKKIPTFAEFNKKEFTCLPADKEVETAFISAVTKARRSYGLPITRRLVSLYDKLSASKEQEVAHIVSAVPPPVAKSFAVDVPAYKNAIRMNIRAPEAPEVTWNMEKYKQLVLESSIKEEKGLLVHFMPEKESHALKSLACKLTKNTWETIRGGECSVLKMKDGSEMDLKKHTLDTSDVRSFIRDIKKKITGPFFIRFSNTES